MPHHGVALFELRFTNGLCMLATSAMVVPPPVGTQGLSEPQGAFRWMDRAHFRSALHHGDGLGRG